MAEENNVIPASQSAKDVDASSNILGELGKSKPKREEAVPVVNNSLPIVKDINIEEDRKKDVSYFINSRKERKELKNRIKQLEEEIKKKEIENSTLPPVVKDVRPIVEKVVTPVQIDEINPKLAPKSSDTPTDLAIRADKLLLEDIDVIKKPGAVFEIMDIIEEDDRLSRIDAIDPYLAREIALKEWKENNKKRVITENVSPTSTITTPVTDTVESLVSALDQTKPGSKERKQILSKLKEIGY